MQEPSKFGLMVAYLLPGFIGLAGIAPFVPFVATWLQPATQSEASLGPPVYAVLAAATIGMILSCFRWVTIDQIHRWTGIVAPAWDDGQLEKRLAAFNYLVENHYRYYQFVGNSLIAVIGAYGVNRWMDTSQFLGLGTDLAVFILCITLFAASRDALKKYYVRTGRLVGQVPEKGFNGNSMYNGNHHQSEGGIGTPTRPPEDKKEKQSTPVKPKQEQPKVTKPNK